MNGASLYLWLTALHVAAAIIFVGGVLATAALLGASRSADAVSDAPGRLALALRGWNRRVTTPAMLAVVSFGLVLTLQGTWFASPWPQLKLVIVVALAGVHGVLSGWLRRLAADPGLAAPAWLGRLSACVLAGVIGIAVLAVVKPGS